MKESSPGTEIFDGFLHAFGSSRQHLDPVQFQWAVAQEEPVSISINGQSAAVMMATPVDLESLVIGFLVSENYVSDVDLIRSILVVKSDRGHCVDVRVETSALTRKPTSRAIEGRSGCGICGVESLEEVFRQVPSRQELALDPAAVLRSFQAIGSLQPMKSANQSVHAAGFAANDGVIELVREDVGRHNALDKLSGAVLKAQIDPASGFVVMTSRCSYELVQKAAIIGFAGLATLSGPTSLALQTGKRLGLPLAFRAADGIMIFDRAMRRPDPALATAPASV